MSKEKESTEQRIDEFAVSMFKEMGYEGNELPDSLVDVYKEFKLRHDVLRPSRLTAEGFALCSLMADMIDGKVLSTVSGEPPKGESQKKG